MIDSDIQNLDLFLSHLWVFLAFPFLIGFVFFIHELGHYAAARYFNTHVEKFSVGFGKKLFQWTDKNDTRWSIAVLPLGGHVKIDNKEGGERSFNEKKFWQKIIIIAAGPIANFLLCFVFILGLLLTIGSPTIQPVIAAIEIDGPAAKAGIKPGDKILRFNGKPVNHFKEVTDVTEKVTGKPFPFVIERDGKVLEFKLSAELKRYKNKDGLDREKGIIGVMAFHEGLSIQSLLSINGIDVEDDEEKAREVIKDHFDEYIILHINTYDEEGTFYYGRPYASHNQGLFDPESNDYELVYIGPEKGHYFRRLSFPESLMEAARGTGKITYGAFYIFGQIFRGQAHVPDVSKLTPDVSVRHMKRTHEIVSLFYLAAMASIIMGLINLLPFPVFDGGQILRYTLIERHNKKKAAEQ